MEHLVKSGFIKPINCNGLPFKVQEGETEVKTICECNKFGGHKLIAVGVNVLWPKLFHMHPGKEEVFLFKEVDMKPLYFIFAYDCFNVFEKKLHKRNLNKQDFIVVEMEYNNPRLSYFIINENVLHGEYTLIGSERNPVFFVTEPSGLPIKIIDLQEYKGLF